MIPEVCLSRPRADSFLAGGIDGWRHGRAPGRGDVIRQVTVGAYWPFRADLGQVRFEGFELPDPELRGPPFAHLVEQARAKGHHLVAALGDLQPFHACVARVGLPLDVPEAFQRRDRFRGRLPGHRQAAAEIRGLLCVPHDRLKYGRLALLCLFRSLVIVRRVPHAVFLAIPRYRDEHRLARYDEDTTETLNLAA